MKIYYQGIRGAYSHNVSIEIGKKLKINEKNIIGLNSFREVFKEINKGGIGILPIENSYAGSIHENFYHLISGEYEIIGEISLGVNHCLLGVTNDINDIKYVRSHEQALMQCSKYLQNHNIIPLSGIDTAGAAKLVSEKNKKEIGAISSIFCSKIYNLNILDKNIQDQDKNTTRFIIVTLKKIYIEFKEKLILDKVGKISIHFKTKDVPSALYKCLGAFATRFVNIIKIESLPAKENRFEYIFWVDIEKNINEKIIYDALKELKYFSKKLVILGNY